MGKKKEAIIRLDDWMTWPLVSDWAREALLGPPPQRDPQRIVIIGTHEIDKAYEVAQRFKELMQRNGIDVESVKREPHPYLIADAFFGNEFEYNNPSIPTIPKGVLVGHTVQFDSNEGGELYFPIDKWIEGWGNPINVIQNLCTRYQVENFQMPQT
jgi:hypothetical protein